MFENFSEIKILDYQAFKGSTGEITNLRKINIIIGPNNIGKSKVLHILSRLSKDLNAKINLHNSEDNYKISIKRKFEANEIANLFPDNVGSPQFPRGNKKFIAGLESVSFFISLSNSGSSIVNRIEINDREDLHNSQISELLKLNFLKSHILQTKPPTKTIYISAERDIQKESADDKSVKIHSNGSGVTNTIRHHLNHVSKDASVVEVKMLEELNIILGKEDGLFDRIETKIDNSELWEIFLHHKYNGVVALSQSGSGLKTILLLISMLNLEVNYTEGAIEELLLLMEEPENNLHPKIQKNMYEYIENKLDFTSKAIFTTHSSVNLDHYQGSKNASVFQIYRGEVGSCVRRVEAFDDAYGVLDALGVRASDGLQTNCVIWVEGPSDRIYLNSWIKSWSKDRFEEGRHYSIMFYGGRLLSHLSLVEQEEQLIRLLRINRRSAVLIDSDKKAPGAVINATKRRIVEEAERANCLSWVTRGREIENYIPLSAARKIFDDKKINYTYISDVPDKLIGKKLDGRQIRDKISLALSVCDLVTKDQWAQSMDLNEKIENLLSFIHLSN